MRQMYVISRWVEDSESWRDGGWRVFAKRVTKRATVRQIRKLQSMGYDRDTSIYVEQRD